MRRDLSSLLTRGGFMNKKTDFGDNLWQYRSMRMKKRGLLLVFLLITVILTVTDLCTGASGMTPVELVRALFGGGSAEQRMIVWRIRMPRVLSAPDAEALLAVHPDVIFSLYTSDSAAMDELQNKTGVPVVVCSYGKTEAFDTAITQSLTLMGEILGRQERAKTVTDYIESIRTDLDRRTRDIPDAEKPTVYLGCQSNYGTHGLGSSTAGYALFDAVHARNVLDEAGYSGYQKALDTETLLTLDPEIMIIDAGGLALFLEEYKKDPTVYDSMRAVKTGEIYLQMPYNAYYTNLEIAFADAYFIGKTLYPDAFADVDAAQKFDEFSRALLGEDCYKTVAAQMYGGYGKLDPALLR